MANAIDYFLSVQSPWTYLGHQRFIQLAHQHNARISIIPISAAIVFPRTGGLPVNQRAPARQAYRLVELARWRQFHGLPMNIHPMHFPADERLAMGMVIALRDQQPERAITLAGRLLSAVWAEELDIGDRNTLTAIAKSLELDPEWLLREAAQQDDTLKKDSEDAIERGVFGMPTYVFKDELFWGQDRLELLHRALAAEN